jgi:hypothetical protein
LSLNGRESLIAHVFSLFVTPSATANCSMHLPPHLSKLGLQLHLIGSKFSLSANLQMQFSIYSIPENVQPLF